MENSACDKSSGEKPKAGFVLCDSVDPEESLENRALYRALCDHWSLDIKTPYDHNQIILYIE